MAGHLGRAEQVVQAGTSSHSLRACTWAVHQRDHMTPAGRLSLRTRRARDRVVLEAGTISEVDRVCLAQDLNTRFLRKNPTGMGPATAADSTGREERVGKIGNEVGMVTAQDRLQVITDETAMAMAKAAAGMGIEIGHDRPRIAMVGRAETAEEGVGTLA